MIWRWVWRTVGLFLARKLWGAWQRRRHAGDPAYRVTPAAGGARTRTRRR